MAMHQESIVMNLFTRFFPYFQCQFRWLDRCYEGHKRQDKQNLFPIVQGGLDFELRRKNLASLIERNAAGYAIGGLAGGEDKVLRI